MFLWSIAWGVIGGVLALAITWGAITNPSSITTNPGAFILTLFFGIFVSTLVASIGIFTTIFKVTVEGTIEQIAPSMSPVMGQLGSRFHVFATPETLVASEVANYFSICPICHAQDSVKLSSVWNFVSCAKCGVQWEVRPKHPTQEIDWLKLVKVGTDRTGAAWLGMKMKPEFWRQMGLEEQRTKLNSAAEITPNEDSRPENKTELSSSSLRESQEKREVSRVRPSAGQETFPEIRAEEAGIPHPVVYCPKCGRDNLLGTISCRNCGRPIPREIKEPPPEFRTSEGPTVPLCPNCGMKLLEDKKTKERVCLYCGYTPSDSLRGRQLKTPSEKPLTPSL